MRALCLALAFCCVSYAAAAIESTIDGKELETPEFMTNGGRAYLVTNIVNSVKITTPKFKVTGIEATGATDDVKGSFFVGDVEDPFNAAITLTSTDNGEDLGPKEVTWTQEQLEATSAITYRIYTVAKGAADDVATVKETLATSAPLTINVLDLKASKPENVTIVRNGCNVEFNMLGIYSKPAMRTFCGLMEGGELLSNLTAVDHDEGVIAFDSSSTAKPGEDSKWAPITLEDAEGKPVDGYAAWQLTDGKLNVKETTAGAAIGAACMVWVDGQDFMEYYGEQAIEVPAKHWCPTNPLKALAANLTTDVVKYQMLDSAPNCWTEEDSDIAAEMSCTGEGKMSNSFTVFCKDGAYMAYSGSKDKAEAYDEAKATAWADETCGTAGILPMTLLVGALALFASRA